SASKQSVSVPATTRRASVLFAAVQNVVFGKFLASDRGQLEEEPHGSPAPPAKSASIEKRTSAGRSFANRLLIPFFGGGGATTSNVSQVGTSGAAKNKTNNLLLPPGAPPSTPNPQKGSDDDQEEPISRSDSFADAKRRLSNQEDHAAMLLRLSVNMDSTTAVGMSAPHSKQRAVNFAKEDDEEDAQDLVTGAGGNNRELHDDNDERGDSKSTHSRDRANPRPRASAAAGDSGKPSANATTGDETFLGQSNDAVGQYVAPGALVLPGGPRKSKRNADDERASSSSGFSGVDDDTPKVQLSRST
ncbi:unnamed protein product, partial [Amoebophrya sp. A120]